jgi:hypothetical protein
LYETRYQVAQTWARLPPPDNYTPAKAQAAYRTIFDGLLNIAAGLPHNRYSHQIAVSQNLDGADSTDWPAIDANGVPLPPQDPPQAAVPMFVPILGQAGTDALACFANHGTLSNGVVLPRCTGLFRQCGRAVQRSYTQQLQDSLAVGLGHSSV